MWFNGYIFCKTISQIFQPFNIRYTRSWSDFFILKKQIYKWLKIKNAEPFSLYVLPNLIIIMLVYLQLQEKQIFIMSFSKNSQQR